MTAADIARLAGVGRAAVSNWRRRHDDFPLPVGGTATSPTFSLGQIEGWLRDQGKLADPPVRERVWQTLRQAAAGDVELSDVMTFAGAFLLSLHADPARWRDLADAPDDRAGAALAEAVRARTDRLPASFDVAAHAPLARALAGLADELGTADAFEFLRTRYLEHHSRRVYMTPEPVVRLMLDFPTEAPSTVLDPACGTGAFLTTAQDVYKNVQALLGQEIDETTARMTAVQLELRGAPAEVRPGDSLRDDAFAGRTADLVVTNPPFNDRNWGYEELTGDPRWEYGLPPRMESELAWLQHGLAHAAPGGLVAMLVPRPSPPAGPAAASAPSCCAAARCARSSGCPRAPSRTWPSPCRSGCCAVPRPATRPPTTSSWPTCPPSPTPTTRPRWTRGAATSTGVRSAAPRPSSASSTCSTTRSTSTPRATCRSAARPPPGAPSPANATVSRPPSPRCPAASTRCRR
ncbi:class I SAM-dependent DNA methyltransferase [Actinomadura sp. WMMB 499]|uniref:HsdM family class I SAM-dependent methyltransferase n=1 Tax=Actinomadura sp. WMMB 499 TaxID=1219491 RepID=UPI0020C7DBCC|nr:N-6 DNA methylase [Actinomadura sp. WMMB 499]